MIETNVRQLIFIMGFPRSGTTWFSNLVNAHPDTVYRHEVFGRQYASFGIDLFRRLKFNHGLSDGDYATVIDGILKANIDTARPPFFRKRFRTIKSPRIQHLAWLVARTASLATPLYVRLYTPRRRGLTVVVKETGSSVNLESIIDGVRADKLITLVRHPYGVIASHLRGMRAGHMGKPSASSRESWLKYHASTPYIREARIREGDVVKMSDAEFLAIAWRVQNEKYLSIQAKHHSSRLMIYGEFLKNAVEKTRKLLDFLEIAPNDQVFNFLKHSMHSRKPVGVFADSSSDYFSVYRRNNASQSHQDVLPVKELQVIDRHTRALVERLGLG